MIDLIYIIIGVGIVLRGADNLTDGAVRIARRFNMPELIIGLTIVALGTSMPELCVSMASALNGTADMAVGNVVGSNIFNSLLIVGVCAMIHPMAVSMNAIRRDLPFAFIATLILIFTLVDGTLTTIEGIIMFLVFAAYMAYTMRNSMKENAQVALDTPTEPRKGIWHIYDYSLFTIAIGLAELIIGSDVFVNHATLFAQSLGVSEAIIGITILGAGTSLPEFATSVVAALKGKTSMALGNVIGSCVFNILMILGLTSIIVPLSPSGISTFDLATMFVATLLLWLFSFTKSTMERWEGVVLTIGFFTYMAILIYNSIATEHLF